MLELILKSTPVAPLYIQTNLRKKMTKNSSTSFESRQYFVAEYAVEQEFRLQLYNRFTTSLKGLYSYKNNREGEEYVHRYNAELDLSYRLLNRGTILLSAEYVYLKGDVGQNSSVSYFMLDGLHLGQNLLWTLSGQISVTQFLQISLQYQGRAMQGHAVIHSGNLTLNALF